MFLELRSSEGKESIPRSREVRKQDLEWLRKRIKHCGTVGVRNTHRKKWKSRPLAWKEELGKLKEARKEKARLEKVSIREKRKWKAKPYLRVRKM